MVGWWTYGLFDLDEGFYASVTGSMIRHHEWITPLYNGKPWFEKPILMYWLAKPSVMLFGTEVGPRLPSVLCTIALYAIDGVQVRVHRITAPPVRSSSLRALGALANVFAIESFIDELAERAGLDPLQLRLDHLDDERAADVLRDAVAHSPWSTWRAAPPANHGIGCALARYKGSAGWCAVVACVSAEAKIQVHDLYISVDVGTVVNPDSVRSQVEGGAVQATSWALTERLGFDAAGVATATWDSYPILRFSDAPAVHVNVLDRTGEPALGAGEIAQGPTAAAIANALAHALGVRVRDLPMTFERVAQAIGA